jgi:hypothetical protein
MDMIIFKATESHSLNLRLMEIIQCLVRMRDMKAIREVPTIKEDTKVDTRVATSTARLLLLQANLASLLELTLTSAKIHLFLARTRLR